MPRYKSSYEARHKRGDPRADQWTGPLAVGDWVLVEGAFGYAYGYGQIAIVRPTRLTLVADSNVDIPFNVRRDQVREVFASREDAGMVHQRLKSLQAAQPFQVFTQHHCAGRYRELRSLAEALHTKC